MQRSGCRKALVMTAVSATRSGAGFLDQQPFKYKYINLSDCKLFAVIYTD